MVVEFKRVWEDSWLILRLPNVTLHGIIHYMMHRFYDHRGSTVGQGSIRLHVEIFYEYILCLIWKHCEISLALQRDSMIMFV